MTTAGANRRWRATELVRPKAKLCIPSRTLQPDDFCTTSIAKHSTARESAASRRVHSMRGCEAPTSAPSARCGVSHVVCAQLMRCGSRFACRSDPKFAGSTPSAPVCARAAHARAETSELASRSQEGGNVALLRAAASIDGEPETASPRCRLDAAHYDVQAVVPPALVAHCGARRSCEIAGQRRNGGDGAGSGLTRAVGQAGAARAWLRVRGSWFAVRGRVRIVRGALTVSSAGALTVR